MPRQGPEQIIRLLKDGQWHDVDEIARRTKLSPLKTRAIAEFLAKYNFVQFDCKNSRVKISRHLAKLFHAASAFEAEKERSC